MIWAGTLLIKSLDRVQGTKGVELWASIDIRISVMTSDRGDFHLHLLLISILVVVLPALSLDLSM